MFPLLASLALGAIVALVASLISQARSESRERFSTDVLKLALRQTEKQERESARDLRLLEIEEVLKKLDITVGNLYLQQNRRTILERPMQVGESLPGSPSNQSLRPMSDPFLPPIELPGMVDAPATQGQNAGRSTRARALAEPT